MEYEIIASDGAYTIGYIEGHPCEWEGNCSAPVEGAWNRKLEGAKFSCDFIDDFEVVDGRWEVVDEL